MIVKMKKLTLLCTRSSQEKTLAALRDLGAVHVEPSAPLEGVSLDQARTRLVYVKRALEVLQKHPHVPSSGESVDQVIENVWRGLHRIQELEGKRDELQQELRRLLPLGDFDPALIRELAGQGVSVRLFQASIKQPLPVIDGCVIRTLSRDRSAVYFVLISRNGRLEIDAQELPLPDRSLTAVRQQAGEVEQQLTAAERTLSLYAGDRVRVAAVVRDSENMVRYLEVQSGMGSAGGLVYLQGFFPAEKEALIQEAAKGNGWAALIRDIGEGEDAPTLLRSPKWVEPIKAVFDMIGVTPGYHEVDISALFLVFLSIFFAFLVGDAGYGLLFIGLTLFFKRKLHGNAAAELGLNLLMIMSVCTVVWGALTGTWFGISLEFLPAPLRGLSSNWLTGSGDADLAEKHVMFVCFTLGAVHLAIARLWNVFRKLKSWACLAETGWLCCISMLYFIVLEMVVDMPPPIASPVLWGVIYAGIGLITVSLILEKSYLGLVTLVLDVISCFVDIISYVRLYAVGAASFAIANSFNQMAIEALGVRGVLAGGLIAALCIFAGHALNIVLGGMSVLVHGIRLNTLEFSGHAGVQWAGIMFKPFAKRAEKLRPEEITG